MSEVAPTQTGGPWVAGVEADQSPTIAALAAALAKAQGTMKPAVKGAFNPHFKSRFADLAAVIESIREAMALNGLAVLQPASNSVDGVVIMTTILHSSGEWIRSRIEFPVAQKTPQGMGSVLSYARRYALSSMLCVAADEDDDGNASSQPQQRYAPPATKAPAQSLTQAPDPSAIEKALHSIAAAASMAELKALVPTLPGMDSVRAAYTIRTKQLSAGAPQ